MWVASSFDDVGRGPQIAAFVYECGGPYGCAKCTALDASSSQRCGNGSHKRVLLPKRPGLAGEKNEAPTCINALGLMRQAPESGCTHHTKPQVTFRHYFLLLCDPAPVLC